MRLLNYLQEEFVTAGRSTLFLAGRKTNSFDIFVNPSNKELQELRTSCRDGYVRFIADFKNKKLYVWDSEFIHMEGLISLKDEPGLRNALENFDFLSTGVAKITGGKLEFIESDAAWVLVGKPWTTMDDKWLNKWFILPYNKTYLDMYHKLVQRQSRDKI